jgi:hypothetical protein
MTTKSNGPFGTTNEGIPGTITREQMERAQARVFEHAFDDRWELMMMLFNPGKPAVVGLHGQTKWRGEKERTR